MAVPFSYEPDPAELMRIHYMRIQNLLVQLMSLLRQTPSIMTGECLYYNIYHTVPVVSLTPGIVVNFYMSQKL